MDDEGRRSSGEAQTILFIHTTQTSSTLPQCSAPSQNEGSLTQVICKYQHALSQFCKFGSSLNFK